MTRTPTKGSRVPRSRSFPENCPEGGGGGGGACTGDADVPGAGPGGDEELVKCRGPDHDYGLVIRLGSTRELLNYVGQTPSDLDCRSILEPT